MVLKNLHSSNGETGIENKRKDMGRGEESVRCMERVTWKLTLPYVKQVANGNLPYGSGKSKKLCINLEGWKCREMVGRFKREGIYLYLWLIHAEVLTENNKIL